MTRQPAILTESIVNSSATTWTGFSSTSHTVWTQVFAANPNRKRGIFVVCNSADGAQPVRLSDVDAPSHLGITLFSYRQTIAYQDGRAFFEIPGTGALWFRREAVSGTATILAFEI